MRKEAADAYKSATLTYEYLLPRLREETVDGTTQPPAVMFTGTQQQVAINFSGGLDVAVLQCAWAHRRAPLAGRAGRQVD